MCWCRLPGLSPAPQTLVAKAVIVTVGKEGALVKPRGGASYKVATVPVEAVDPVGAGDAFDAAFIARLVQGAELKDAVAFGWQVRQLRAVAGPHGNGGADSVRAAVVVAVVVAVVCVCVYVYAPGPTWPCVRTAPQLSPAHRQHLHHHCEPRYHH